MLLTPKQVIEKYFSNNNGRRTMSENRLRAMVKAGKDGIPGRCIGGRYFIPSDEFEVWLTGKDVVTIDEPVLIKRIG